MIEIRIIAALLRDVHKRHGLVLNTQALKLTLDKVNSRVSAEGLGFLTKTLPRLGKAFDKALSNTEPLSADKLGLSSKPGSKLPKLFGELIGQVLNQDGRLLPDPCVECVKAVRQLTYLFYKYELPYSNEQEQSVISKFERTEEDLSSVSLRLSSVGAELRERIKTGDRTVKTVRLPCLPQKRNSATVALPGLGDCIPRDLLRLDFGMDRSRVHSPLRESSQTLPCSSQGVDSASGSLPYCQITLTRVARRLLNDALAFFDPRDIVPRHGPGAVATRQKLWDKFHWSNISRNITAQYPADEYYYSSLGHVCDQLADFGQLSEDDLPARVVLVPKDSRGPRLISCEPVDYQWIQQGIARALVDYIENKSAYTMHNVFFSDQGPNQRGALLGSSSGRYATLDLNEASDRVSLDLVRLLFPERLLPYLEAARSSSTELPCGRVIPLQKFAPMGSSLCFPILALTVWAILTAGAPDADTRESILVYGDDVIVPTAHAVNAIEQLESFGLKINRDKSCTSGFFRESCGTDAFKGINVTPVRLRTVWSPSRSPESYSSWVAYANSFYEKQYFETYDLIVGELFRLYREIPSKDMSLTCPSLYEVPVEHRPKSRRFNRSLQKHEWKVWDVKSPSVVHEMNGWSMLLRYHTERGSSHQGDVRFPHKAHSFQGDEPFSVRLYTKRSSSILQKRWR